MQVMFDPLSVNNSCSIYLFHGLGLSSTTDTGHRQTDVNSWANTLVEQFSFQEDLSIGNRDDIGRDVSRDIT